MTTETTRQRGERNRRRFADMWIRRLNPPKSGQELYWDTEQKGLGLLVSAGGAKTFFSQFRFGVDERGRAKWPRRTLGRFDEVVVDNDEEDANVVWAREQVRKDRAHANKGIDPRKPTEGQKEEPKPTFKTVLGQFIELYAKPNQKSWKETERVLTKNCAAWFVKPIDQITERDAYKLLDGFVAAGRGGKAAITLSWLRAMWRWAARRKLVPTPPIMDFVDRKDIGYTPVVREKVYSAEEIRAIWAAADQLDTVPGSYVKLVMLLAPRKSELAGMRWPELDDADNPTLWTTPAERTKTRKSAKPRVYLTPLSPLAARIFKSLPRRDEQFVFPGRTRGKPIWPGSPLQKVLIKHGAPSDFNFHAMRHTVASHFTNYSDFEVGLVLNHTTSGVTAGYRHSYALDLKRKLLNEWADHVEGIVAPQGVARLR